MAKTQRRQVYITHIKELDQARLFKFAEGFFGHLDDGPSSGRCGLSSRLGNLGATATKHELHIRSEDSDKSGECMHPCRCKVLAGPLSGCVECVLERSEKCTPAHDFRAEEHGCHGQGLGESVDKGLLLKNLRLVHVLNSVFGASAIRFHSHDDSHQTPPSPIF